MKPILIKAYPVETSKSEVVRLQKDATVLVSQFQRQSGLSASYIVSEIIRQASSYVQFEEEQQ